MRFMRLAFSAGALVLLTAAAAAKPGIVTTTVNLRASADTTSAVLGKIPGSGRVEVGECTNGWCAVTWKGKSGFVIETALDMSGRLAPRARVVRRAPPPGYRVARRGPPPGYYAPDDDVILEAPIYGATPPVVYYEYAPVWGPNPIGGPAPWWGPGSYFGRYGYWGRPGYMGPGRRW